MKKILASIVLWFSSLTAYGADWTCTSPSPYQCEGFKVGQVYLNFNSRTVYFGAHDSTHYFSMGEDSTWSDDAKAMYSMLLSAKATGTEVNTYYSIDGGYKQVLQIILMKD
ncbi:hypothetical protein A3732_12650 [Oleiphilus sp. HI0050]|nr:hypothetical protein A3732_12650 [Oleiphilus sp. HI0050]